MSHILRTKKNKWKFKPTVIDLYAYARNIYQLNKKIYCICPILLLKEEMSKMSK